VCPLQTKNVTLWLTVCIERRGPITAPMLSHETGEVLFEKGSIDIVAPFERGKCGYKYLLTYILHGLTLARGYPIKSNNCLCCAGDFD